MNKYILRFWFDYGGICLWGLNDLAKKKFGYAIENRELPLSNSLLNILAAMNEEYSTYISLKDPTNKSSWTEKHKLEFLKKASEVCVEIKDELGAEYEIINDVANNIL